MPILNSVVSWLSTKRLHQIDLFQKYPIEVQNETLYELIRKASQTEWGKRYEYASITPDKLDEFAKRVPTQEYDQIKGYVDRLRKGEQNLLWPGEIKWFSKSSGTTSDKSKFIPVSNDALDECHYQAGKDIIAIYNANYPDNKMLLGKTLALGGSHQINNFSNNSYFGDVSAILIQNMPFWAQFLRTPDKSIALMAEWEKKLDLMAQNTINENVTNIAGVPSWTLLLLQRIKEITGAAHMHEVWPGLEVFVHGGVNFAPYRAQYDAIIDPSRMRYMETYNASEGFFAMQNDPEQPDMLLMLDYGVYYEFIPMDEFHKANRRVLNLSEVELGVNYAMLITTNAGLWRYIIGDTVQFSSRYPFKIQITGRTKHFINAFGEEVIVDNAERALARACKATNATVSEYTAAPIFMTDNSSGGHEWVIEFAHKPDSLDYFMNVLDNELMHLNSDYEAKRYKNKILAPPRLHVAPQGTFIRWLEHRGRLGGQNKVPRLSNNRQYIDDLISLLRHTETRG